MTSKEDSRALTRRHLLLGAVGVAGATLVTPAYGDSELVIVVNKSNKETPSTAELAALFTTRKQSWSGGERVVPFNFPAKHAVRVEFDKAVLDLDPDAVARYWIDRKIRGGNAPPKQVANAQLIVRLVEKLNGAIGYVPRSAVSDSVRIVSSV